MSALNGDKSRFQRQRKATLRRRARSRITLAALRLAATRHPPEESDAGGGGRGGGMRLIRGGLVAD